MATGTAVCESSSHQELSRTKGFLGGTLAEVTAAASSEQSSCVAQIQAMTNNVLLLAGEKAMQDVGDNLLVLDELRQRFRKGITFKGYAGWQDFIEKNSRYSIRTIQTKLAEVNGKDESKVNKNVGNKYTRGEIVSPSESRRLDSRNTHVLWNNDAGFVSTRCGRGEPDGSGLDLPLAEKGESPTCKVCNSGASQKHIEEHGRVCLPNAFAAAQKQNKIYAADRKASPTVDFMFRLLQLRPTVCDGVEHAFVQSMEAAIKEGETKNTKDCVVQIDAVIKMLQETRKAMLKKKRGRQ